MGHKAARDTLSQIVTQPMHDAVDCMGKPAAGGYARVQPSWHTSRRRAKHSGCRQAADYANLLTGQQQSSAPPAKHLDRPPTCDTCSKVKYGTPSRSCFCDASTLFRLTRWPVVMRAVERSMSTCGGSQRRVCIMGGRGAEAHANSS